MARVSRMCGLLRSCFERTPDPRPPEKRTTRTVSRDDGMEYVLIRNRSRRSSDIRGRAAPLLPRRAHQKLDVRDHLLDCRHVHLARTEAGRALSIANPLTMFLTRDPEIELLRVLGEHVPDHLA